MVMPTPPPEMSRDDEAGAVAAATYFMTQLYPYTEMTQETASWVAMSHQDCIFCKSILEDVATQRLVGRRAVIAPVRINRTSTQSVNPAVFSVTLDMTTGPDEDFNAEGVSLGKTAADSGTATIVVVRQADKWLTRGVELARRT
jgi:hypothetical protein